MYIRKPPLGCVDFAYPVIPLQSGLPKAIPHAMVKKRAGKGAGLRMPQKGMQAAPACWNGQGWEEHYSGFLFLCQQAFVRCDRAGGTLDINPDADYNDVNPN